MSPEQRARSWYPSAAWGGGNNKAVFDGVGGRFLWKPVSDSTKKCAVHTPAGVRIASLTVGGKTYGVGSIGNGYRPLFRLDKPGGAYGAQVPVQMNLHGGGALTIFVPNGGQRFEKSGFKDTDESPAPAPSPAPNEPLFRVTGSSLVFSSKAAPFIEQVYVVSKVNSKGQAEGLDRCQKVNAVTWAAASQLSQYTQPAFFAVDVADRIERLIPHSVRGWVYVNAKGEIVQFGAQPLPPPMPTPTPAPEPPAPEPSALYTRTESALTLRADFAAAVRRVDALANVTHGKDSEAIKIQATRVGNTWTLPQALGSYKRGALPNTWRISITPGAKLPDGVTMHTSINQSFIRENEAPGKTYPTTTRK